MYRLPPYFPTLPKQTHKIVDFWIYFRANMPIFSQTMKHSLDRDNCKYIFSKCKVWWCVPKVWTCVLCTLDWSPVANHCYNSFRVHDDLETTVWSQDDDPVGKLAIRLSWMKHGTAFLSLALRLRGPTESLFGRSFCQQKLRFHPLSHCPWCRASKTIQKSVFRANRRFEEHLAIAGTLFVHSTLGFCQGECPLPPPPSGTWSTKSLVGINPPPTIV